jgi:hypothetical protein
MNKLQALQTAALDQVVGGDGDGEQQIDCAQVALDATAAQFGDRLRIRSVPWTAEESKYYQAVLTTCRAPVDFSNENS